MNKRELIALFGSALVAERAFAQFGGGRRGRGGMDSGGGPGKGGKPEPTPMLEVTLHELQEDLKLAPEQQPLFDVYVETLRGLASDVTRERQRQSAAKAVSATLIERIDRNVDALRNRLAAVEDIAQAAKALYARLNPDQQRAADPRLATLMLAPLSQEGPMKPPASERK
ncbi:MAG TPA: Spy/CpxP family protein refolding chaperone [Burkholderiales bacterium]|nr:Spy/CpxP family protein refolding chaperone [Burkholderiales bacterium]